MMPKRRGKTGKRVAVQGLAFHSAGEFRLLVHRRLGCGFLCGDERIQKQEDAGCE